MRRHLGVIGLATVAALAAVSAAPASAAVTPLHYEDPAGDALDVRPSMDIVKVTHDVRQINRTGPPSFVVEITLAAAPETQAVSYHAEGVAGECQIDAAFRPGTAFSQAAAWGPAHFLINCPAGGGIVDGKSLIKGETITLSVAMDSIPKEARAVGVLSELVAFSQIADPAVGIMGNGYHDTGGPGVLPTDTATTDQTFKFA